MSARISNSFMLDKAGFLAGCRQQPGTKKKSITVPRIDFWVARLHFWVAHSGWSGNLSRGLMLPIPHFPVLLIFCL